MLPAAAVEADGLADEQPASRKQAQAPSAAAAPAADRRRAAREAVEREMSAVMPIGRRPAWAGSRCQVTSWHRAAAGRPLPAGSPPPAAVCQAGRVTLASQPQVVIVGGGISGLAAAFFLAGAPVGVTVLEGSSRLGGKLAVSEVAGAAVDEGAEALLARRPEGTGLIRAAGLGDQLAVPGTTAAQIWSRQRMRPLPGRQVMGVPADLDDLARCRLLSAAGLARAREDLQLPATERDGDVDVAGYVAARFGQEVVDRLVDPLLGGVYAGRSEKLSFEATLPALAAQSRRHAALTEAAAALLPPTPPAPASPGPDAAVFTTLTGGLGTLPAAVAAASGAQVRTGAMARELARTRTGWRLTVGSAHDPGYLGADAVVLAVPAAPAGRLLAGVPGAAAALAGIGYASMVVVTLAYLAGQFPRPPEGSGYLVPAVDGHPVKAVTFSSVKWPHLRAAAAGLVLVRCSLGRAGEEALLQREDADLAGLAAADLAAATGVRGRPAATRVTRWGGALPQYTVGHLDRVARIRAAVARQPGLAVCGAAYDGLGIPACIGTARGAAGQVLAYLRDRDPVPVAGRASDAGQ
jgi:oxygen-dependent protoporphyrinogen oxidase